MIRGLITFSLRYPPVVLLLAIALLVAGGVALRDATWDIFPEFAPPLVVIQTEAPGFSTEEVEQLITIPIESAINGVSRLKVLRSSSAPGLCVVTAIFEEGTRALEARQVVAERLVAVRGQLPDSAEEPKLVPMMASTSRLLMVGITSDRTSPMELRTLASWTLRRRIQAVRGVAHIDLYGGDIKQYQILVSPERLKQYDLSLTQVLNAGRSATGFGGAGFLETPNQRLPIRQRTRIESAADIAAVPVRVQDGVALPLGHVAEVVVGAADKFGGAQINGKPGVLMVIFKQPDFNTLKVTSEVQQALDELKASLPAGVELHPALFRQATFIDRAIGNLRESIWIGCLLVTVVLVAFLWQWRTLAISLTAIPLSLMGAILILRGFGVTLNAMTLGGLAIALGEVVDDAIVDVENVLRRLKDNRLRSEPLPTFDVVLSASLEVRSAVVYASFIVMLVFLPVFCLEGLAGKFFGPLALAYVVAILVSLGIALTVTPAMCLWLLSSSSIDPDHETWLIRGLNAIYRRVLSPFLRWRGVTIGLAVLLLVASCGALPFLGGEFLPDFRESNFVVIMAGKPDSSLVDSERVGQRFSERLLKIDGIKSVVQQIGRAELSEDTWGPNISEVWLVTKDDADYDKVLDEIREAGEELPGYVFQTKQFLRERIDEVLTGSTADIVIRVVGPDLDVLRAKAGDIATAIHDIPGVFDLRVEQQVDVPQVEMLLKPREAARYGFSVGEVNHSLQTLLRGTQVGQVFENDTVFDVVVRAVADVRRDPRSLGELLLDSPGGEKIPVKAVSDIALKPAPNVINREQGRRRMLVTCNAEDRDVESVITDIRRRIAEQVKLPPAGYHVEYAGEFQAKAEAQQRLLLLGAASLVGILLLLYLDFRSLRLSLMVMLSVPLACVGGIAAVLLSSGNVSLGSMVGFVTIFGVAVRNGILLISNYQHLRDTGGTATPHDLVLRGSVERLSPILMTAATTALAILPLIISGNLPGYEIEHPMAIVIMGGLISSTVLTLFVLPSLYLLVGFQKAGNSS